MDEDIFRFVFFIKIWTLFERKSTHLLFFHGLFCLRKRTRKKQQIIFQWMNLQKKTWKKKDDV